METFDGFMTIFYVIIGIYSIYAAIAGKGYAYKNDYPEEMKEEATRMTRILLAIIGPLMLIFAALEYFKIGGSWTIWAEMILVGGGLVAYTIVFRKRFGKILKKNKRMP